ncbi:MAG TPA: formylmethanofuran dehydrogenase subunit A, partial [Dongiaceae bacterium]|nr:formylmethanofuran dehydrogenase subunit A [Dongiaceae bacterium]
DKQAMFEHPDYVFKDGRLVVEHGAVIAVVDGATHVARPQFDRDVEASLSRHFEDFSTVRLGNFKIGDGEIEEAGGRLQHHDCVRVGA